MLGPAADGAAAPEGLAAGADWGTNVVGGDAARSADGAGLESSDGADMLGPDEIAGAVHEEQPPPETAGLEIIPPTPHEPQELAGL